MISAVCYQERNSRRSAVIAAAMADGIKRSGDHALVTEWSDEPAMGDVGIFYGWRLPEIGDAYRAKGRPFVHVDLGWWDRKPLGRPLDGYHKVAVNARDPGAYFERSWPSNRFDHFGIPLQGWRQDDESGAAILMAGMSAKSAGVQGFEPYEWERATIWRLRQVTDREIIYRPKPSWLEARPLQGTTFSPASEPLDRALDRAWAVVTLTSNVAVDAVIAGIPFFAERGVASVRSMPSLSMIERPPRTERRLQLLADIAYCQWSVPEMKAGECWDYLKRGTPLCT